MVRHQKWQLVKKGMKKIQKRMAVLIIFGLILVSGISLADSNKVVGIDPYFTLVLKYKENSDNIGYANLIKQQLARIGIQVDLELLEYSGWLPFLLEFRNTDLAIIEFVTTPDYVDPDYTGVYDENGSLNVFGYHTSVDWNETLSTGKNEWYIQHGKEIMPPNSEERIQHYWEWEQYLMDELLLCQPLFNRKSFEQSWNTLVGYNYSKGLLESWGEMYWSAPHIGQENTTELVISDQLWDDLNPLLQDDSSSELISEMIIDPLFWINSDSTISPHLAKNFTMLNDTHIRISLREGIKWQSDPDGNFTNEYFDADDVYFTLYSWAELSNDPHYYDWIDDMKIIDNQTIDLFIDGNPATSENEPYSRFLGLLAVGMLPEFYLNQTQNLEGEPNVNHHSWNIFSESCFGTGLFSFDSYIKESETILTINPDCWWLNNSLTSDPDLDWLQRFGSFTNILQKLRIKIMKPEERIFAFYAGEVDVSPELSNKPSESLDYQTQFKRRLTHSLLTYNIREFRPVLGNREPCLGNPSISKGLAVRKAISYAINRAEINSVIHGGDCYITDYPIHENYGIWCNPNIIRYDYDLEKAKYYMELAGYSDITEISAIKTIELLCISISVMVILVTFKQKQKIWVKGE